MKIHWLAVIAFTCFSSLLAEESSHPQKKDEKPEFVAELEKANALHQDEKLVEAEKAYKALRGKGINDATWAMTSNNLGINLRMQKKYEESSKVFNEILLRKLNNRDPGGNLMEHFRNYHYNACIELVRNYSFSGNNAKAIEALKMTKKKYPFESCCATCEADVDAFYDATMTYLEKELKKE